MWLGVSDQLQPMDEQTRTAGSDVEDDCFFMKQEGQGPTGILINIYTRSYKKKSSRYKKKKVRKKIASITQSCLAMDQG